MNPKVLQVDEIELLESLIGGTMARWLHGGTVQKGGCVWECVGIEVDGGLYELSATNACVAYYRDLEDYCPLRFRRLGDADAIGLGIVGDAPADRHVGKSIVSVLVCTETEVSYCDERSCRNIDTRAVAFVFEDGDELVFDRSWCFQEAIDIYRGPGSIWMVERSKDEDGHEEGGHLYRSEHSIEWRSLGAAPRAAFQNACSKY